MFDNILDFNLFTEIADWRVLSYILLGGILLTLFKSINGLLSGYDLNTELTEKDNKAISLSLAGFLFSLCIIIHGVLVSPGDWSFLESDHSAWLADLKNTSIWATIGCAYLLLARLINDKLILPQFSNKQELVEDENAGVGIVQAASYISTALVIRATLSGPETLEFWEEFILTLVWFVCTQALLILFAQLYQILTKYDMHEELREDNVAVGVSFGGNMIAFGILLSYYISTYDNLIGLFLWALLSCLILWIIRVVVDKAILPQQSLDQEIAKDRNWGASTIEACAAIGAALIVTGSF